jgi:hypothetical protein
MDIKRATETIQRLAAMDSIHIHADLILGLPEESRESFLSSFNQLFQSGPNYIQMGLLKLLPGTRIRKEADRSTLFCRHPPYQVLATAHIPHSQLRRLYHFCEVVESFYNNRYFPSIWRYLRQEKRPAAAFFSKLLEQALLQDFFNHSPTQTFLNQLLVATVENSNESALFLDLLRYDWLHCGHRYLPKELHYTEFDAIRSQLRRHLPQNLDGYFDYRGRDQFLKKTSFLSVGQQALSVLGCTESTESLLLCFLPEQTRGVHRFQAVKTLTLGQPHHL